MNQYYQQFVTTLYRFVSDIHRYHPVAGTQKILDVYDRLDMGKVILRYYTIVGDHNSLIHDKNPSVFSSPFNLLPGIELSAMWPHFSSGQQKKIWTYLNILYVLSDIILQNSDHPEQTIVSTNNDSESRDLSFNPYVGIGETDNNYGVDDLFAGAPPPDSNPATPGLGSIANLVGLDKMINLDDLRDQLANMNKDDIDDATNNIKSLLGSNMDDKTTNLISNMLSNITNELKKDNVGSGNPLDNIVQIAETVAANMKPQIDNNDFDISNLINSTQHLANQCTDDNGNSLFNGTNPFDIVNKMMNDNSNSTSEADYINNCNNMLRDMGMNNIDLSNFHPPDASQ